MTRLPDYESRRIPEGEYLFTFIGEPEKRKHSGQNGAEFISIKFRFRLEDDEGGDWEYHESFLPWEERYRDLLIALGGEPDEKGRIHLEDVALNGKSFRARIVYSPDKNDPTKSWARIANIQPIADEDIPF